MSGVREGKCGGPLEQLQLLHPSSLACFNLCTSPPTLIVFLPCVQACFAPLLGFRPIQCQRRRMLGAFRSVDGSDWHNILVMGTIGHAWVSGKPVWGCAANHRTGGDALNHCTPTPLSESGFASHLKAPKQPFDPPPLSKVAPRPPPPTRWFVAHPLLTSSLEALWWVPAACVCGGGAPAELCRSCCVVKKLLLLPSNASMAF